MRAIISEHISNNNSPEGLQFTMYLVLENLSTAEITEVLQKAAPDGSLEVRLS